MFTKSHSDISATLGAMINRAKEVCNYDEEASKRQVAAWVKQDRRFDAIGMSAAAIAAEAFSARQAGRALHLGPKQDEFVVDHNRRLDGASPVVSIWGKG
jgi:hypothetical protein